MCNKCGQCCIELYAPELRIYQNLTLAQKKQVWKPRIEGKCCQLRDDNLCAIQVEFGLEALCLECQCEASENNCLMMR